MRFISLLCLEITTYQKPKYDFVGHVFLVVRTRNVQSQLTMFTQLTREFVVLNSKYSTNESQDRERDGSLSLILTPTPKTNVKHTYTNHLPATIWVLLI